MACVQGLVGRLGSRSRVTGLPLLGTDQVDVVRTEAVSAEGFDPANAWRTVAMQDLEHQLIAHKRPLIGGRLTTTDHGCFQCSIVREMGQLAIDLFRCLLH